MPKKKTVKAKKKSDLLPHLPLQPEEYAQMTLAPDGLDLPKTMAEVFKRYYSAYLGAGFVTEQAFELTRETLRFYLDVGRNKSD